MQSYELVKMSPEQSAIVFQANLSIHSKMSASLQNVICWCSWQAEKHRLSQPWMQHISRTFCLCSYLQCADRHTVTAHHLHHVTLN